MARFHSPREAKEFLVARIVGEAARENVALSEVERKMLYFSETHWTLPDIIRVNKEFERDYDPGEYEKKIAHLAVKAAARDRRQSREEFDAWLAATRVLEKEDHYILVMIQSADLRPRWDQLKLFIAGLSAVTLLVGYPFLSSFISQRYGSTFGKYFPSDVGVFLYVLVVGLVCSAAYLLGWVKVRW
jgi:hypothetical protein